MHVIPWDMQWPINGLFCWTCTCIYESVSIYKATYCKMIGLWTLNSIFRIMCNCSQIWLETFFVLHSLALQSCIPFPTPGYLPHPRTHTHPGYTYPPNPSQDTYPPLHKAILTFLLTHPRIHTLHYLYPSSSWSSPPLPTPGHIPRLHSLLHRLLTLHHHRLHALNLEAMLPAG